GDMEQGHTYLKAMREKTEQAMAFLEEPEADQLREEVDIQLFQLEELTTSLRTEHSSLEKYISLSKDFMDKYKAQAQWVKETKNFLASSLEPKAELYQKKAQLAKYKTHVQSLVEWVKEHEDYNSELQEVEKWLLQMSSRLVTSDSMQTGNMEMATQQLARHKVVNYIVLISQSDCCQQLQSKQTTLTKMTETVSRLIGGQDTSEHADLDRLSHSWLELCHQANKLQTQREEDLQRSKDYHVCITADSMVTLEDMGQVEARLREARDWAEEQQPALSEAMKMSPPPELAQSFLFDHLSICSELEAKQLLLAQAMADADRVLPRLGLSERQHLQLLISDTQSEVESLSVKVVQRRKHLSKAFTERTQFLMAVNQSISWVQQNEKKTQAEEYIALLPDDLAKQVRTCRNIQSSLKAYQSELTSLWSQGRDLMREASDEERNEILTKLQELQNIFDRTLHRCGQKLQELEKVLVSRKYFKSDLEKICQWLKQADIITFPEINLMVGDAELQAQLLKYQQIIEQAFEYENLLLIVQRAGQEILPTLNEVDHCYLDEKLNTLPQQYNSILALAKEKQEKIQQAILTRNEYTSFIDVTHRALKELEDQFNNLGTQPVGLQTEEVVNLQSDYKAILADLGNLGLAVSELNQKKEGFRSTGQPWRPEEMTLLVSLYNGLKRLVEQKVEHLDETLESFEDHKAMAMQVDSELKATKEQLVKVNAETQSAEERLKNYHALAGSLQSANSHLSRLMEQMDSLAPRVDQAAHDASKEQVILWQEELRSLQAAVGELIEECENRFIQSIDFETEMKRTLDWLQQIRDELSCAVIVDVRVEKVQEEIRKQQILQEEVQSSLRIVAALSSQEKQEYISANELVPAHITLEEALVLCQKYHFRMQSACEWLEDAVSFLQQASLGVDVENYEECLRQQADIMSTEQEFLIHLEELQTLLPQLENLVNPTAKEQLRVSVESAKQRGVEVRDQLQCHQDVLHR
ncbi:hypothetical protein GOODEAATRI_010028, partial [Goodea atripinnis]